MSKHFDDLTLLEKIAHIISELNAVEEELSDWDEAHTHGIILRASGKKFLVSEENGEEEGFLNDENKGLNTCIPAVFKPLLMLPFNSTQTAPYRADNNAPVPREGRRGRPAQ